MAIHNLQGLSCRHHHQSDTTAKHNLQGPSWGNISKHVHDSLCLLQLLVKNLQDLIQAQALILYPIGVLYQEVILLILTRFTIHKGNEKIIKWPKSIDLATSYSYNSGHGHKHEHEIYLKTSSNSSKLLQTPPDTFQTLPNPVQTCPNPVQMRPNTSKCVKTCPNASKCIQMHPNASKCSKLVQIYYYSYNSGGEHGHEIYFKTSSNSSLHLPNSSKPCPHLSKPCPNASKHVQMCQNVSKCIQPLLQLNSPNTSPSPTFILNHFPLLATCVHSLLDNFIEIILK